MYKFIYQNKKTGIRIYSHIPLDNKDLELVFSIKNGAIKKDKVIKKYANNKKKY